MLSFDSTFAQFGQFLSGAAITLFVSLLGTSLGIVMGLALLLVRRTQIAPLRWVAGTYVSFVRGTPLLVQIFLIYYAFPGLTGIDLSAFTAGVMALALNSGAFASEILRGGLSAIPRGQFDAAAALSLPKRVLWFRVVLPQLLRLVLAPLVNEFTVLVKASALLSVITVVDLTRAAQNVMNVTYRPIEAFGLAAVFYFVMLFALSTFARSLEQRTRIAR